MNNIKEYWAQGLGKKQVHYLFLINIVYLVHMYAKNLLLTTVDTLLSLHI